MLANLEATKGLIHSQSVLLALVDAGLDRQAAYKLVQRHAHASLDGGPTFLDRLVNDPEVRKWLPPNDLAALFDPLMHLRHVGELLARVGLHRPAEIDKDSTMSALSS
jgi:adenylosuccinate lyase